MQVLPEDLLKFGLIPEFVGRLPVIGAVRSLDEEALVRILVEPKNALVKQFRRVFELDNVELELTEDALEAVAQQALLRGTGARGLRAHPRGGPARGHVRPAEPRGHRALRGRQVGRAAAGRAELGSSWHRAGEVRALRAARPPDQLKRSLALSQRASS